MVEVSGSGYEPSGSFRIGDAVVSPGDHPVLAEIARIAMLCNDAALEEIDGAWTVRGDPTEGALLVLGRKAGLDPEALRRNFPGWRRSPFPRTSSA